MTTVLLVDDDESILRVVRKYFEKAGFTTLLAANTQQALETLAGTSIDLVVLDIMLPDGDGVSLCERIRRQSGTPVIMMTARGAVEEKITAFKKGADDYIVKPFDPNELIVRAQAVLKRVKESAAVVPELHTGGIIHFEGLSIDRDRYTVLLFDEEVKLTRKEYLLLEFFAANPNRAFSRTRIVEHVWGADFDGEERVVDITVDRLRKSLATTRNTDWRIKSVRGVGYMFEVGK